MNQKAIFSAALVVLGLLGLFVYDGARFADQKLKVVFCDVGQGDAAYIRTPEGKDILIDGGPDNSVLMCLSENMPFWDKGLDLVILTHPDSDHYSGLIPISQEYVIDSFVTSFTPEDAAGYQTLRAILEEKRIEVRFVCQGDKYSFADAVEIEFVWPRSCSIASTEKNDNSVVSLLSYKKFKVLITGDAEVSVGKFYQDLAGDIDILRVPHHGSNDGVDERFLDIVKPEVAVISSGKNNRFGHPTQETLDALNDSDSKILRTDQVGDIIIKSNGDSYSVESLGN